MGEINHEKTTMFGNLGFKDASTMRQLVKQIFFREVMLATHDKMIRCKTCCQMPMFVTLFERSHAVVFEQENVNVGIFVSHRTRTKMA